MAVVGLICCGFAGQVTSIVTNAIRDIKSLQLEELGEKFRELGEPSYRSRQIADWLYKKRVESFEEMTDLPHELRGWLANLFGFDPLEVVRVLGSRDSTRKFLFRLADGNLIESVLIPASAALYGQKSDRRTICISTVFMGMGEPLANLQNAMRAIRIINAPWGLGIGARHITVSTSGLAPQIRKLADEPLQIRLAVSLHGATDEVRNQIMPINRRYNIETLLSACDYYAACKKQRLTFEYILIASVNDSDDKANLLAQHALRLSAKVNLIPYNTVEGLEWSRPSRNRQEKFLSILREQRVAATLRREKGHDINAACGQLRLQTKRDEEASPSRRRREKQDVRVTI